MPPVRTRIGPRHEPDTRFFGRALAPGALEKFARTKDREESPNRRAARRRLEDAAETNARNLGPFGAA